MQALDFNPFQASLLASGASDSEIYIWDMNSPNTPLSPGTKTLPPDNISCVAWNRQVQHIMASASPCGRCVVWDLRKNEPIIKVSDQSAMVSEFMEEFGVSSVQSVGKVFANRCLKGRKLEQQSWRVNDTPAIKKTALK